MWLEIHLKKMFIDRVYLDYDGFETVNERQQYQERLAEELYFKHLGAIKKVMEEPEFYVRAESKMNDPCFLSGMWEDLINEHGSQEAKLRSDEILMAFPEIKKLNEVVLIPKRNYTPEQEAFRSEIIKAPKKYVYPKKSLAPKKVLETLPPKFERQRGVYSNKQWSEVTEEQIEKKG